MLGQPSSIQGAPTGQSSFLKPDQRLIGLGLGTQSCFKQVSRGWKDHQVQCVYERPFCIRQCIQQVSRKGGNRTERYIGCWDQCIPPLPIRHIILFVVVERGSAHGFNNAHVVLNLYRHTHQPRVKFSHYTQKIKYESLQTCRLKLMTFEFFFKLRPNEAIRWNVLGRGKREIQQL